MSAPGVPQGEAPGTLPLCLSTLDTLRALVIEAQGIVDELVWVASDAVSPEPVCTPEAARLDIDRHGARRRSMTSPRCVGSPKLGVSVTTPRRPSSLG